MKSLSETLKELEGKKRSLEEQVDSVNEEVSKLKSSQQIQQVASVDKNKEDMELKEALEVQIAQHREQHQKQVSTLRNEIEEKQAAIAGLKDETQKTSLAFEQLQRDHDKLKEDEQDKSRKLNVRNIDSEENLISY
jgi:kinesin family protein 5